MTVGFCTEVTLSLATENTVTGQKYVLHILAIKHTSLHVDYYIFFKYQTETVFPGLPLTQSILVVSRARVLSQSLKKSSAGIWPKRPLCGLKRSLNSIVVSKPVSS